jgi:hypothetical protein
LKRGDVGDTRQLGDETGLAVPKLHDPGAGVGHEEAAVGRGRQPEQRGREAVVGEPPAAPAGDAVSPRATPAITTTERDDAVQTCRALLPACRRRAWADWAGREPLDHTRPCSSTTVRTVRSMPLACVQVLARDEVS